MMPAASNLKAAELLGCRRRSGAPGRGGEFYSSGEPLQKRAGIRQTRILKRAPGPGRIELRITNTELYGACCLKPASGNYSIQTGKRKCPNGVECN
ncbi:hypothetical protein CWD77_06515 [Rhodohalobacter barkolensis]|uniref:Uncharacterized protein n=1 Tax=Rhodohalobacter barkolensis TaxID=2053187 RepID=A0A2N0VLM5_9BACT|nr:hypothetical protein CWD77_06515 [Rhodohalobacter barkolensis]